MMKFSILREISWQTMSQSFKRFSAKGILNIFRVHCWIMTKILYKIGLQFWRLLLILYFGSIVWEDFSHKIDFHVISKCAEYTGKSSPLLIISVLGEWHTILFARYHLTLLCHWFSIKCINTYEFALYLF